MILGNWNVLSLCFFLFLSSLCYIRRLAPSAHLRCPLEGAGRASTIDLVFLADIRGFCCSPLAPLFPYLYPFRNIEGSGGNIAKFITGICMAYWPINRAEDALTALQQINEDLAQLRGAQAPGSALSLMYSRSGVHYGRAMLCNAGTRKVCRTCQSQHK